MYMKNVKHIQRENQRPHVYQNNLSRKTNITGHEPTTTTEPQTLDLGQAR